MADRLINVKGFEELQKELDKLPAKIEANIMRGALRSGAVVVQKTAKKEVPKHTGKLAAGLVIRTSRRGGRVTASVVATGPHAYLAPWIEFGTAAHKIKPKSKGGMLSFGGIFASGVEHPGQRAKPFMRYALQAEANNALQAIGAYVKKRLTKEGVNMADSTPVEVEV